MEWESSSKLESGIKRNCDETESTSSRQKHPRIDTDLKRRTNRDRNLTENLNEKLYEMQKTGELCDYELKTEDGGTFKVHKWVLSASSPFFAKLLDKDTRFKEKNSDELLVRRVSTNILEKIIEFMYTGETEISSGTAKEIIDISLFLNLFTLVDYGIQMLIEILNEDNCLDLLKYSELCMYFGEELTKKCLELICEKFDEFVNLPDFLELSLDTIKLLIVQERISCTEENLFLAVKKWITYDLENRKPLIKFLLDRIQLNRFTLDFTKLHVFHNDLLKVEGYKDQVIDNFLISYNNCAQTDRGSKSLYGLFRNTVVAYDYEENRFSELIIRIDHNRRNFGITNFDKKSIVVCGGEEDGKVISTCAFYSIEDKRWEDLPSLNRAMCPKLINLGDEIYALEPNSKSIHVSNIFKPGWYTARDRIRIPGKNNFSLCHSNNCLYYVSRKCVIRIDSRKLNSDILCEENIRKSILSSEMNENFIYGFTSNDIRTFDIRNEMWLDTTKSYEVEFDCEPLTCVFDNKIHVFPKNGSQLQIYNLSDLSFIDCKDYVCPVVNSELEAVFKL